jgi:hypothetical protein
MKLAKTIACGAAALSIAIGTAFAVEGQSGMNDNGSPYEFIPQQETYILLEPVEVTYYDVYGIDENADGVVDDVLFLEESDTLG